MDEKAPIGGIPIGPGAYLPSPAAPKPSIRVSGGNSALMPDFRPVNAWGRAMPKPARPIRPLPADAELCQIVVKAEGRHLPVGPKAPRDFCEMLLIAINRNIAAGRERVWSSPEIVAARPVLI